MIFYFNGNGDLLKSSPENVYQGSNKANTIYLVAPFLPSAQVSVRFTLPNGEHYPETNAVYLTPNGKIDTDKDFSMWITSITNNVTAYSGTVTAQFFVNTGNETVALQAVSIPISQGVVPNLPAVPETDIYDEILAALAVIETRLPARFIVNVTYDENSGKLTLYYNDTTTVPIEIDLSRDATSTLVTDWLRVITFTEKSWVEVDGTYILALTPKDTTLKNDKFIVQLEQAGTEMIDNAGTNGNSVLADNVFKGTDGTILITSNSKYAGRVLLIGGEVRLDGSIDLVEYQKKADEYLNTSSKEVVEAINEVNAASVYAKDKIDNLNVENLSDSGEIVDVNLIAGQGSIRTKKGKDFNTGIGAFGGNFGSRNKLDAHNSFIAGGQDNEALAGGQGSVFIAGGNSNKVGVGLATAIGHNLRVNVDEPNSWKPKHAFGLWNKDVKDAIFIIGKGYNDEARENAFVVYYDGHAEVQMQGYTNGSVVRKIYVDTEISKLNNEINKKIDKQTESEGVPWAKVYAFKGTEQKTYLLGIDGTIWPNGIPVYQKTSKGSQVLFSNTPEESYHVATKGYVDDTIDTDINSTSATLTLIKKTRYVRKTLTELELIFKPQDGNNYILKDGDQIVIEFVSGSIATTVTRDTTNAIYNFSTVGANKFVELNAEYKASIGKWVVLSAETPYTAS